MQRHASGFGEEARPILERLNAYLREQHLNLTHAGHGSKEPIDREPGVRMTPLSRAVAFITVPMLIAVSANQAIASGVVGSGTAASCNEAALDTALASGGTVTFNCGSAPVTITVTSPQTIAADTSIDGGDFISLDGNAATQVFVVNSAVTLTLANLSIVNGIGDRAQGLGTAINNSGRLTVTNSTFSGNSGGVAIGNGAGTVTVTNSTFSNNSGYEGGAIYNGGGTLTVTNSTFSGNVAHNRGFGGAIENSSGTVTVTNSTFSGNLGIGGFGGAIDNGGTLILTNSTFTGNSAFVGGAIYNGGTLIVTNSTFSGNGAEDGNGGAIENFCADGVSSCAATLTNTIVANSPSGGNCVGTITDDGHNLDDGTTCGFSTANGSLGNTDPKLAAGLADNGGPTQTIALEAGSPAINAGDESVCAAAPVNGLDQRGFARPRTGYANCSIGAYEYNSPGPPPCTGDCNDDGQVTVDELLTVAAITLGNAPPSQCLNGIPSGAQANISLIIQAGNNTLSGCGS